MKEIKDLKEVSKDLNESIGVDKKIISIQTKINEKEEKEDKELYRRIISRISHLLK